MRMLRILAILAFVAALGLAQGGRSPAVAVPVPGGGLLVSVLVDISTHESARHDETTCPPLQANCHSSGSPTVALGRGDALPLISDRVATGLQLSGCNLRSIVLKRDPPIPRALV